MRTRLTVLYAVLFLIAGASLSALTYGLLASRLPTAHAGKATATDLLDSCKQQSQTPQKPGEKREPSSDQLQLKCKQVFTAGARAASRDQRAQTLSTLLVVSLVGLVAIVLVSGGLGWFIAGRALLPVRRITDTARRASELHLGERLALRGPQDELQELADTFDDMLERLDRAFASQKRFVANAAHELRTPLTAMRTSIEVTVSKPNPTREQLDVMAAKVTRAIHRAEATIEALLALAISERGTVTHERVDLAIAAEDALDAGSAAIERKQLSVDATLQTAPASGDPILLERMIANLVENAVRHNIPGGWIRVHTGASNGSTLFEISNSGPHIPADNVAQLFEPFGRAEQRLHPQAGVGLGLSIAQAIAHAHGATIIARGHDAGGLHLSVTIPQGDEIEAAS